MSDARFITKAQLLDELAAEMTANTPTTRQLRDILKQAPSCDWNKFNHLIEQNAVIDPNSEVAERQKASTMQSRPYIRLLCNKDSEAEGRSTRLYKTVDSPGAGPEVVPDLYIHPILGTPAASDLSFTEGDNGVRVLMPGYYQINTKFLIGFSTFNQELNASVTNRIVEFEDTTSIDFKVYCQSRNESGGGGEPPPLKSEVLATLNLKPEDFVNNYARFMGSSKVFYLAQDDYLTFGFDKQLNIGTLKIGNVSYQEYMQLRKVPNNNPGANPQRDFYNYIDIVKISD